MTYEMNALCQFTASSKDHEVPDSKHAQAAPSLRSCHQKEQESSTYFLSGNSFNIFHEASVVMEKVLERFSCYFP